MQSTRLNDEVTVFTSVIWQTNCTVVDVGQSVAVIDSPVFPLEIASVREQVEAMANGRPIELVATHRDWDHIFGRFIFPDAPLHLAATTASHLADHPEVLAAEMQTFDEAFYVSREPLDLSGVNAIEAPGSATIGNREIQLYAAPGHTEDGMCIRPVDSVLACGDYISPLEIARLRASLADYFVTLDLLAELVAEVEWVVPGHGPPIDANTARTILDEDRRYLEDLPRLKERTPLPAGRDSNEMKRVHEAMNVPAATGEIPDNPDLTALGDSRLHRVDADDQ